MCMAYEHIKNLLSKHGEDQTDLAKLIGRSPAVITNLFNGSRSLQIEEVEKLAEHYEVSTDYILYGRDLVNSQENLRDSELALAYALKEIIDILLNRKRATKKVLIDDFTYALDRYQGAALPNAALLMVDFLAHVKDEQRQGEQQAIRKLLELAPPKSA